jgi:hypothetical protein
MFGHCSTGLTTLLHSAVTITVTAECSGLLCLTETWHDADCPILGRLRSSGLNSVDQPRPRAADADDLFVNHGGIVIVVAYVLLSPITIIDRPSTFELVCARVVAGRFVEIFIVLYRPGSAAVQQRFFDVLSPTLDRFATCQEPIYLVGDFNIKLNHADDPHSDRHCLLVDCYGLKFSPTGPTHRSGGTLDAVAARDTPSYPLCVVVEDVSISDHFQLQ